ncbi:nickel pincer cofactor biosynthesis protein LarB [Myxococcota bacterium]|nr:nickel pincer cofactor biosynthesis protein LarB [Myxococcota bacterium]MCZ7620122.1 nickel pincer cofactor biosynthesis protein LarB [Myxococcota bacterium]
MDRDRLRALLEQVQRGEIDPEAAVDRLAHLPFVDTPHARVDTHRALRQGLPEVVYGPGKTPAQMAEIIAIQRESGLSVLVTRVEADAAAQVLSLVPEGEYDAAGRLLWFGPEEVPVLGKGLVLVVSAGTSDLPVAAEAAGVARRYGNRVELLGDVGVAGIHRLLASSEQLRRARVLIVLAGMEGALPSVVGGMVDKPVIAVPTSVGYGASFGGLAALLGMLTSCASNVCVVNIDNGFGAAHVATLINRL